MDFSMSAASFCVELFNYDSLIITLLNREKPELFRHLSLLSRRLRET